MKPSHWYVIAERFAFYQQGQQSGGTVIKYLMKLLRLATHCQFNYHLEEPFCDRFVCGLGNEDIQKQLLVEDSLELKHAVELAQSMETADQNAQIAIPRK